MNLMQDMSDMETDYNEEEEQGYCDEEEQGDSPMP